jgi:hypothetical protein
MFDTVGMELESEGLELWEEEGARDLGVVKSG